MTHSYKYPRPALTADTVVFSKNSNGSNSLLLIRRAKEPFANSWALPGGFVEEGERSEEAARRELKEETGLEPSSQHLTLVGIYDSPGRDPRGWTVSAAYTAYVENEPKATGLDDAAEARWYTLDSLPELAFDHKQIIADAIEKAKLNSGAK